MHPGAPPQSAASIPVRLFAEALGKLNHLLGDHFPASSGYVDARQDRLVRLSRSILPHRPAIMLLVACEQDVVCQWENAPYIR